MTEGMQPLPVRQPPDPAELRRNPPATPVCARVRGLMRDFADGDLTRAEQEQVELHVHGCRACAVALARAEHEVVRLRRAYGGEGLAHPGPRFAQRVMATLLQSGAPDELPQQETPASGQGAGPAAGTAAALPADPAAVARGRRPGGLRARTARAVSAHGALHWSLVTCAVTTAAILGSMVFWQNYGSLRSPARLSISVAQHSYRLDEDGVLVPIEAGDGLPAGSTIRNEGGLLSAGLHDQSDGRQPGSNVILRNGQLTLGPNGVQLDHGTLVVHSHRPTVVGLPNGARAELGVGEYHLDVMRAHAFDDLLALEDERNVRLEVLEGDAAKLVRGQDGVVVGNGNVGRYRGLTPIVVEPGPSLVTGTGGMNGSVPRTQVTVPDPPPDLSGSVREAPSLMRLGGAPVQLAYMTQTAQAAARLVTDAMGRFELAPHSGIKGDFVVVQIFPPDQRLDLGVTMPDACSIVPTGEGFTFSSPFALEPSPALWGSVVDSQGRGIADARIVPCVYDELFGLLLPWTEAAATTDAGGGFVLFRLPAELPKHMSLGVIALHSDYEPEFRPVPLPASTVGRAMGDLRIHLRQEHPISLRGLQAGQRYQVYETVPDLDQDGAAACVREVEANGMGEVPLLQVGHGQLWLRRQGQIVIRALTPSQGHANAFEPGTEVHELGSVFRQLVPLPGTDFQIACEFRHQRYRLPSASPHLLQLWGERSNFDEAQVFALRRGPGQGVLPRFLGIYRPAGDFEVDLESGEEEVVAIGNDGGVGFGEVRSMLVQNSQRLQPLMVSGTGSLVVGLEVRTRPLVLLKFEPRRSRPLGNGAVLYRHASAETEWTVRDLPAGEYRVTSSLGPSAAVTVTIEPQTLSPWPSH